MPEAIIITPVKDSPDTTRKTLNSIKDAKGNFEYYVFNDFSKGETRKLLEEYSDKIPFTLINLEDLTDSPSPNYNLVLQTGQNLALKKNCPLIIVESDVIVKPGTFTELLAILREQKNAGMVGAITVNEEGHYNFPYTFEKVKSNEVKETSHSLSFCCTLICTELLQKYSFHELSDEKDWYDVFISRQSKRLGFKNYLAKGTEVIHLPHSSRPWKNLKYTNPILYYYRKYMKKRDRI